MEGLLSFENPVFAAYAFYTVLLFAKILFQANVCIPFNRVAGNVFLSKEDLKAFATPTTKGDAKRAEAVDLLRRINDNDRENIVPFAVISLVYVLTNPAATIAIWHFRAFAGFRFLHTIAYSLRLQPARFLCFLPASITNMSIIVQVLYAMCTM